MIKLKELQQALHRVTDAAVLVSPQVINSAIQQVHTLPAFLWEIPHSKSFVVNRHILFRHIEPDDLELNPDHVLPDTVILLRRPSEYSVQTMSREEVLQEYWTRLFHATIHAELERQVEEGRLTLEEVRRRIKEIGEAAFREAHGVLQEENILIPSSAAGPEQPQSPDAEISIYIELAASFLELRYFASTLLPTYFPAMEDYEKVEEVLSRGLEVRVLFNRTRLPGAPEPVPQRDDGTVEANDFYWRLERGAQRAAQVGNLVRAAILRTRAARVAPADLTRTTRAAAESDIRKLTERLKEALHLSPEDVEGWTRDLNTLLEKADQGNRPVEARLLFDLQNACVDHEREIYALSVADYLVSLGRRPIRRPLPSQRLVRIIKHLRSAAQRLTTARLSDDDRAHLGGLIQKASTDYENRLRHRFRPVLEAALKDVGLLPQNAPERAASGKIIEEILDRIIEYGFLTFSDLRDTISRNQLKLPDLEDPREFSRGDPLLRLDRRLGTLLDGVYRRGEIYMTVLERMTSVNFGTQIGRFLTLFLTVPVGCAFILVEGLFLILHQYQVEKPPLNVRLMSYGGVAFFILLLLHWRWFRTQFKQVGVTALKGMRFFLVDLPLKVASIKPLRELVVSLPFQIFYWVLFKPLLIGILLWLWFPFLFAGIIRGISLAVFLILLINSPFGRAVSDLFAYSATQFWHLLRGGLLRQIVVFCLDVFKAIIDAIEGAFYTIDEWLRFRRGEGELSLIIRAVLGAIWFPISYVARFYVVVLIEPGFNPIKAPISILAAKFIYPFLVPVTEPTATFLTPFIGSYLAWGLVVPTFWLVPDVFGFLVWEMKENWRLYRANRSSTLTRVRIGPHGETMRALLQPGFHSGTIPRLFAKLRRAEQDAMRTGNWSTARSYRQSLHEIEEAIRRFVERNMLTLLRLSTPWENIELHVGRVRLAGSRVRVEVLHAQFPDEPLWLEFSENDTWLLAGIHQRGWLDRLRPDQLWPLNSALASLYKLAGIGFVREQLHAVVPDYATTYDITRDRFILWEDHGQGKGFAYNLVGRAEKLYPRSVESGRLVDGPTLDAKRLIFARVPLYWNQWVECWNGRHDDSEHCHLLSGGSEMVLSGHTVVMRSALEDQKESAPAAET